MKKKKLDSKELNQNCNFHYETKSMMASQILKSGFHRNKAYFLQVRNCINYTSRATLTQKILFVAEVTFKYTLAKDCYTHAFMKGDMRKGRKKTLLESLS